MKLYLAVLFLLLFVFGASAQDSAPKLNYKGKILTEISNMTFPLSAEKLSETGCSDRLETFNGTILSSKLKVGTDTSEVVLKSVNGKKIFFNLDENQIAKLKNYQKTVPAFLAKGRQVKIGAYSCSETGRSVFYYVERVTVL